MTKKEIAVLTIMVMVIAFLLSTAAFGGYDDHTECRADNQTHVLRQLLSR